MLSEHKGRNDNPANVSLATLPLTPRSSPVRRAQFLLQPKSNLRNNDRSFLLQMSAENKNPSTGSPSEKRQKTMTDLTLTDLPPEVLTRIVENLDSKSALALLQSCKTINKALTDDGDYWKHLCKVEGFAQPCYSFLQKEEDKKKMSTSGEVLHDVDLNPEFSLWRKVLLRGLQMRRNVGLGRYDVHRFLAASPKHREGLIEGIVWNENFFVYMVHWIIDEEEGAIDYANDVMEVVAWEWDDGRNPRFLYRHDMKDLYPDGGLWQVWEQQMFVYKKYLVILPNPELSPGINLRQIPAPTETHRSMIRVHDLSTGDMRLAGSYDFSVDEVRRRYNVTGRVEREDGVRVFSRSTELNNVGDFAVVLCRTSLDEPKYTLFVFSLPESKLLRFVDLSDALTGGFEMKNPLKQVGSTLICGWTNDDVESHELFIDCESLLSGRDVADCLIAMYTLLVQEWVTLLGRRRWARTKYSGEIMIQNLIFTSGVVATPSHIDTLVIPPLPGEYPSAPFLYSPESGKMIVAELCSPDSKLFVFRKGSAEAAYTIDLSEPRYGFSLEDDTLHKVAVNEDYLACHVHGKICMWRLETGDFLGSMVVPRNDGGEWDRDEGPYRRISIAKNGSIVALGRQEGFPVVADVYNFW